LASILFYSTQRKDFQTKQPLIMSSLLYIIAIILVIGWILGAFVYTVGGLIHILLVLAIIAVLFRLIGGRAV